MLVLVFVVVVGAVAGGDVAGAVVVVVLSPGEQTRTFGTFFCLAHRSYSRICAVRQFQFGRSGAACLSLVMSTARPHSRQSLVRLAR